MDVFSFARFAHYYPRCCMMFPTKFPHSVERCVNSSRSLASGKELRHIQYHRRGQPETRTRIETILTSKKASPEATQDEPQSRRNRGKTVRRSLVEASEAQDAALLARELRTSQTQQELAVIVVVEFTGELRKRKQLTAAARLARTAAAVVAGEEDIPVHIASTLEFDASRAEFEELARSAGAAIAATSSNGVRSQIPPVSSAKASSTKLLRS
jgi:hypothetical protein